MTDPVRFAHRGARAYAPENTLAAFEKAIELAAPWIELDVHAVAGGLPVIHDDRLERTTNGTGYLNEYDIEELRQLDAGEGQQIPLLEEVLELARGRVSLNVELKSIGSAVPVANALRAALRQGWEPEQLLVSSFFHRELQQFSCIAPEFPRAALTMAIPTSLARFATELNCEAVHASMEFVDPEFIEDAHNRGLKVRLYTVNHPEEFDRATMLGVDGVFTDDPSL